MFDVVTGQATQVAQHEAPIKVVGWVDAPGAGVLATGSWDKTIKVCLCFFFSIYVFSFFVFFLNLKNPFQVLGSADSESSGDCSTSRKMLYI